MARGTRSSHAAVEANGLAARSISQARESVDDDAGDMEVDDQEPHVRSEKTRKRKSPELPTSPNGKITIPPIDLSPAKRTRSQLRGSNPLSPPAPKRPDTISPALLKGNEPEVNLNDGRVNGAPASHSTDEVATQQNGRRSSFNATVPAVSPAPAQGRATRGSNRVKARIQPASNPVETERDDVDKHFTMDEADEGEDEVVGVEGGISRSKRRQILGVLLAMESNPPPSEHQTKAPRSRLVKIVDVPFSSVPIEKLDAVAEGNGAVIKEETMDGAAKSVKDRTLRRILLNKDEVVTVERFFHDLWSLSAQLLPSLPNPFADEIKRSHDKAMPFLEANPLTIRLLGSKTKQDKDLPIYDHLLAVKDAVTTLASQDTILSKALQTPAAKTRWALHQRTTVPWPMQPRRGDKSAPVVATDRVHLDWFTSIAATENGKLEDVDDEIIKAEGVQDQEDEGTLTRLQAEGYLGFANIATVAPPDREAEEISRSSGPKLGQLLYTSASAKLCRYRTKRREAIPIGCPVTFLSHTNSFTPSFAPTYDSTLASGGWSFHSTNDAAWAASSSRQWIQSGWNAHYTEDVPEAADEVSTDDQEMRERALRAAMVLQGGDDDLAIDPALLDALETQQAEKQEIRAKLDQNARNIQKLCRKQDERLRRGEMSVSDPEEHALALEVSSNLQQFASRLHPRALLPGNSRTTAMAANLSQTTVHTPGPVFRGTLDPARPKALAENYTVHTRDEPAPPKRREIAPTASVPPARPNVMLANHVPMGTPTPMARHFSGSNGGLPPAQVF